MGLSAEFNSSSSKKKEKVQLYNIHGVKVHVTPSEKPRMQELFDSLSEIPAGRKALADMKKYKIDVIQESNTGAWNAFYSPDDEKIVLGKKLGKRDLRYTAAVLVHEACHMRQCQSGLNELLNKNLDLASSIMVYRAMEADAYTQEIKAHKEFEELGYTAHMKKAKEYLPKMLDTYNKGNSLSDTFKAWYNEDFYASYYEKAYETLDYLENLHQKLPQEDYSDFKFDSLKPSDIAKYCGGDYVEGFNEFMASKEACQVNLLTKTIAELNNERLAAQGMPCDASLADIPVRDLKDNPGVAYYAKMDFSDIRERFDPKAVDNCEKFKKETRTIAMAAVKAVEKMTEASINGTRDEKAEKTLKIKKKQIAKIFQAPEAKKKKEQMKAALIKKANSR